MGRKASRQTQFHFAGIRPRATVTQPPSRSGLTTPPPLKAADDGVDEDAVTTADAPPVLSVDAKVAPPATEQPVLWVDENVVVTANEPSSVNGIVSVPSSAWEALPQACRLAARGSSLQNHATLAVSGSVGRATKSPTSEGLYDIVLKPDDQATAKPPVDAAAVKIPVIKYRSRLRFMPIRVRKRVQEKANGLAILSVEVAANTALSTALRDVSLEVALPQYPKGAGVSQPACKPSAEWSRNVCTLRWPAKGAVVLDLSPGGKIVFQALVPLVSIQAPGPIVARCRCADLLSDIRIELSDDATPNSWQDPASAATKPPPQLKIHARGTSITHTA